MANKWDTLDNEQRRALAMQAIQGSEKSADNLNRAMQHLAANPRMVDRMMQEAGMEDEQAELDDAEVDDEEGSIEDNIEQMLAEEGSPDVQEAGSVASDIPPPEEGEDARSYAERLLNSLDEDEEGASSRRKLNPRTRTRSPTQAGLQKPGMNLTGDEDE